MPSPRDPQVWGPAAIALASLAIPVVRGVVRPAVTAVHEAGHVVVGMATGRLITGVTIRWDLVTSGGGTGDRTPTRGPTWILTALAGYPAPSAVGLGLAYLLHQKYSPLALFVGAMLFFGLLFLLMRNFTGLFVGAVLAFACYLVVYRSGPHFQLQAARTLTWFMLLGGVDGVLQLREVRFDGARTTDVDKLFDVTLIPGIVWEAAFLFGTWVALVYGIRWMFT